jgi:hypothetical protein
MLQEHVVKTYYEAHKEMIAYRRRSQRYSFMFNLEVRDCFRRQTYSYKEATTRAAARNGVSREIRGPRRVEKVFCLVEWAVQRSSTGNPALSISCLKRCLKESLWGCDCTPSFDEVGSGQSSPCLVKVNVKSNNIIRAVGTTRYQRETHDFTPTNSDPTLPKSPT